MNLYRVISEEIWETIPILDYGVGPMEPYRIAELVAARTRGQAKWTAWRSDSSFEGSIEDMPKFSVKLVKKEVEDDRGVVTNKYEELWR